MLTTLRASFSKLPCQALVRSRCSKRWKSVMISGCNYATIGRILKLRSCQVQQTEHSIVRVLSTAASAEDLESSTLLIRCPDAKVKHRPVAG